MESWIAWVITFTFSSNEIKLEDSHNAPIIIAITVIAQRSTMMVIKLDLGPTWSSSQISS